MNARSLGVIVILIALVAVGIVVFLQGPASDGGTPADGNITNRDGRQPESSRANEAASGAASAVAGARRQEARGPGTAGAEADEPIVVFGKVSQPAGFNFDGLEVELRDAAGDLLTSEAPNPEGNYEIRFGRALLAGWSANTAWVGVRPQAGAAAADGPAVLTPSFERFGAPHEVGDPAVRCDLAIGLPPAVEGRVFDRATGAPIASATVSIVPDLGPWKDTPSEEAETDDDGKYKITFQDLPARDVFICCKTFEGDHQSVVLGPLEFKPGELRTIDFTLDANVKFGGRVVDDASGEPIANAVVSLMSTDYAFSFGSMFDYETATTDAEGKFELDAAQIPLDRAIVKFEAKDRSPAARPAIATAIAEVRLGKPVVVSGKVTDAAGRPIPNVLGSVSLAHEWSWNDPKVSDMFKTGADGSFSLTLVTTPADDAVVYIDFEPFAPFLGRLREMQSPASSALTREINIKLRQSNK